MKRFQFFILFLIIAFGFISCSEQKTEEGTSFIQNGDLIFTRLDIPQVIGLAQLSKSDYVHAGIVFLQGDTIFVFEAAGKVDLVTLDKWIARNKVDTSFVVKRLKNEYRKENFSKALINEGQKYSGRYTDIIYNWSDSMFYGPELVWKVYQRGLGLSLCPTKKMKDWNYKDPMVLDRIAHKYSIQNPFVLEDTVVSVDDIFNSDKLELVFSGRKEDLPK